MTIVANPVYNCSPDESFEPYTHQVGGHCCILKFAGKICKPLNQREYEFYCTIHKDYPLLSSITPEFNGYLAVPKAMLDSHEEEAGSASSTSTAYTTRSSNNSNQPTTNVGLDSDRMLQSFGSNDIHQYYIVLQDLTAGMIKPCVMDMKMGTYRQRFDTSVSLGFRLCGMRVWRREELYSVDRLFGRGLTTETVEDAVSAFLFDGQAMRTQLIPPLIKKLRNIMGIIETSPFRFYTSSLLFIYDGDSFLPRIDVRIVDFAHAIIKNTKEGEADDGVLFGLHNLITLFEHFLERYGLSDGQSESDSDADSVDVHSFQDTDELEEEEDSDSSTTNNNNNNSNNSSSNSNSSNSNSNNLLSRCAPLPLSTRATPLEEGINSTGW